MTMSLIFSWNNIPIDDILISFFCFMFCIILYVLDCCTSSVSNIAQILASQNHSRYCLKCINKYIVIATEFEVLILLRLTFPSSLCE